MRKVSMATRRELVEAVGERYRAAERTSKGKVLDEFVAVTELRRKHVMRILREKAPLQQTARPERRIYTEAARNALILLWEASDRLCGKRLKPLIPILIEAMEGHGHLDLEPEIKAKLLQMSAATIDRALKTLRESSPRLRRRGVAGSELRRSVPIRTFSDWGDPAPGHMEADLVSHSGPMAKGSWAWTLTLTPATPFQRLMDEPRTSEHTRQQLRHIAAGLDPVRLLRDIRAAQQKLVVLADAVASATPAETASPPPLVAFLLSLRTLWKNGEARPTATAKPPQKRGRRRPDPLVQVADQLETWFEEEPWRTGRELLERLQAEQPGNYPNGLHRAVQRRLKGWRTEKARALVFSHMRALASEGTAGTMAVISAA